MSPHHGETPHDQGERQQSRRGQSGQPGQFGGAQQGPGQGGGQQGPPQQGGHQSGRGGHQPGRGGQQQGQGPTTQGPGGPPPAGSQGPPGQFGGTQQGPGQGGRQPPSGQGGFQQPPQGGQRQGGPGMSSQGMGSQGRGGQQPGPPPSPVGGPPSTIGGPQSQQLGGPGQFGGTQPGQGGMQQGMQPGMSGQMGAGPRRGPQLSPVTVEDIIQGDPVTAEPDTPVPTLVAKMAEEDVGSVVIVKDDQPVGVITDRKIAMAIHEHEDLAEVTAEALLDGDIETASLDDSVFDVLNTLRESGIRRLPVVDDEGDLVGVVALDDIIVLLGTEMANVGETIQNQIERLG